MAKDHRKVNSYGITFSGILKTLAVFYFMNQSATQVKVDGHKKPSSI